MGSMIVLKYQLFPRSVGITEQIQHVIECFERTYDQIKSPENELKSDEVLDILRPHLEQIGFTIEAGKAKGQKIPVPVLFGLNNTVDQSFNADGISNDGKIVLEVEAGRATANFAFLNGISRFGPEKILKLDIYWKHPPINFAKIFSSR